MNFLNIKNFFTSVIQQIKISSKLLKFSLDKEAFFFEDRAKVIEIIKNTIKIDDFLIMIFALIGLILAFIEVSTSFFGLK